MRASSLSSSFSSPWPDPNSPVLSKIDFGVPLVELFKWLDVRDTLLGVNHKEQDITAALALARDCKHFDAEWLTSIFEGKDVSTKEGARKVFLCCENDARALCFAFWLADDREEDLPLLRRASEMGNAFACSTLCLQIRGENNKEAFRLARLAAAQHERDGFFQTAYNFHYSIGCEEDSNSARENFLVAAELGHKLAAHYYGGSLYQDNPVRWVWWGRSALQGFHAITFLENFSRQVEEFFDEFENGKVVFMIGHALKGNIDMEKKEIFGSNRRFDFHSYIGPANQAVSFYDSQIKSARLAVDTWKLVATRLHMIKDMRIFIGKMIWEARFEANYEFDLDHVSSSYVSSPAYLTSASLSAASPVLKRSRK